MNSKIFNSALMCRPLKNANIYFFGMIGPRFFKTLARFTVNVIITEMSAFPFYSKPVTVLFSEGFEGSLPNSTAGTNLTVMLDAIL